jgi:hypothetical protein
LLEIHLMWTNVQSVINIVFAMPHKLGTFVIRMWLFVKNTKKRSCFKGTLWFKYDIYRGVIY